MLKNEGVSLQTSRINLVSFINTVKNGCMFTTMRFTDLGKLNFPMVVWFYAQEPIFSTAPAASKNDTQFKRGQNRHENKQLALFI